MGGARLSGVHKTCRVVRRFSAASSVNRKVAFKALRYMPKIEESR